MKNLILTITWSNRVLLALTLLLYLTVILGMYAQVLLGAFHLLSFVILSFYFPKIEKKHQKHLFIYLSIVVVYFTVLAIIDYLDNNFINSFIPIIGFFVIPMIIGGYYTYIIEEIRKYWIGN